MHCAIVDYARLGPNYASETRWIDAVQEAAIARSALQPGKIVADMGCGVIHGAQISRKHFCKIEK